MVEPFTLFMVLFGFALAGLVIAGMLLASDLLIETFNMFLGLYLAALGYISIEIITNSIGASLVFIGGGLFAVSCRELLKLWKNRRAPNSLSVSTKAEV